MSDYTPTTEQVRAAWAYFRNVSQADMPNPEALASFDRWIAGVREAAWNDGFDSGHYVADCDCGCRDNPYRT